MAVMSCLIRENLGDYFWLPFFQTAKYLGMYYLGNIHPIIGQNNETQLGIL